MSLTWAVPPVVPSVCHNSTPVEPSLAVKNRVLPAAVSWRRAHDVLRPQGCLTLLGHVVVRRPGEPEVYAATADVHERFARGNPDWGHPPLEDDVPSRRLKAKRIGQIVTGTGQTRLVL